MQFIDRGFRIAVHRQVAFVVVEVFRMVGQVDDGADSLFCVYLSDDFIQYVVGVTDAVVVAVHQYFFVGRADYVVSGVIVQRRREAAERLRVAGVVAEMASQCVDYDQLLLFVQVQYRVEVG